MDAYMTERCDTDPSFHWYQGEIDFFDNYIIPLASRLKACGVFGSTSNECYENAKMNRKAWEENGENLVEGMMERYTYKQSTGGQVHI